jgi:hypothetical protein
LAASDGLVWALVAVAFILGAVSTLVIERLRTGPDARISQDQNEVARQVEARSEGHVLPVVTTPPGSGPAEAIAHAAGIGGTVQTLVLTLTADRLSAEGRALVNCPPGERLPCVWHVHLSAVPVLAIPDGRTISLDLPPPSHDWKLPSGRRVHVADGRAEPRITHDAVSVHVTGPYVKVTLDADGPTRHTLTASAFGDPRGPSELRADLSDPAAAEAALRQAIDLAAGSRLSGSPVVLSYSRAAWDSHARYWLEATDA